jgi:hypothetical protein
MTQKPSPRSLDRVHPIKTPNGTRYAMFDRCARRWLVAGSDIRARSLTALKIALAGAQPA